MKGEWYGSHNGNHCLVEGFMGELEMNTVYNPKYEIVTFRNIPMLVALGSVPYDNDGNEVGYIESVLIGWHEMVDLLSDNTLDGLFVSYKQQIVD